VNRNFEVIVIGAGAAGLMCAIEAGKRNKKVLIIEHSSKIAEKIRISGGGRCNFTNLYSNSENFLSNNKHFCKSAFSKYTQNDFIDLVKKHKIKFHEKKFGQLFCDHSAKDIIEMLITECEIQKVEISLNTEIKSVIREENLYILETENKGKFICSSLVIATGGLSIPKIGASDYGYKIANQFNLKVTNLYPALVPLTFKDDILEFCKSLAGVSIEASVKINKTIFNEGLIFTHRGISGPSILQISSYWKPDRSIEVNLLPLNSMDKTLKERRVKTPKQNISNVLSDFLPNKLAMAITSLLNTNQKIGEASNSTLNKISNFINKLNVLPTGTEGYKTAEVTLGGIDTNEINSATMECKKYSGLYFIGEVVDVTGHLGGHNFQWAWSSGYVAGQNV
jgi:predicted Rossmann fold flavoprotein